MSQDLEELVAAEARRMGLKPLAGAVRRAGADLAGSQLTSEGLISMPNIGVISPRDFVNSLARAIPDQFEPIEKAAQRRPNETMTEHMRRQIQENRMPKPLPSDFEMIRNRSTGLTKLMMDQIAQQRQQGDHQ